MTLARAIGLPASKDGTYASTSSFLLHSTVAGALARIREYPVADGPRASVSEFAYATRD